MEMIADQHPFAIPVRKLVKACPFDAAIGPREICPNVRQGDDVAAQIEAATYMIDADMETLQLAILYHRVHVIRICCLRETRSEERQGGKEGVRRCTTRGLSNKHRQNIKNKPTT